MSARAPSSAATDAAERVETPAPPSSHQLSSHPAERAPNPRRSKRQRSNSSAATPSPAPPFPAPPTQAPRRPKRQPRTPRAVAAGLWAKQNRHRGDRARLFAAVADYTGARTVLYPGSYVDVAPSSAIAPATYVDSDARAARFFEDAAGVAEIVGKSDIAFIHADYKSPLDLPDTFDLLVSLYAGPISAHCTRHLRLGGTFLVNSSHGDAALAALDERYELRAAVAARNGSYKVDDDALETYLVPKRARDAEVTAAELEKAQRGFK